MKKGAEYLDGNYKNAIFEPINTTESNISAKQN